jgi:hypothetical protein
MKTLFQHAATDGDKKRTHVYDHLELVEDAQNIQELHPRLFLAPWITPPPAPEPEPAPAAEQPAKRKGSVTRTLQI